MISLALDLGTVTGWAMVTPDGRTVSGTESFKPGRFEGGGMRYLRFRRWLTELKSTTDGLGAVYFEEVRRHAGVDAAHAYGGFLATLTAWCEHHQIPYAGVPVGTIKRHATGKGNASKVDMMAAARAAGHEPADDNEADALALLHWAQSQSTGNLVYVADFTGSPRLDPRPGSDCSFAAAVPLTPAHPSSTDTPSAEGRAVARLKVRLIATPPDVPHITLERTGA